MISLRAYARHRAGQGLPGATLAAVQRAIRDGRVQADSSGKIDPDAADLAWANNTRMMAAESRRQEKAPQGKSASPPSARDSGGPNLAKAQLAHELVRVRKASLQLGQLEGTLGDMAEAGAKWQACIVEVRNQLLRVRHSVAVRFSEEAGAFVDNEIRRILRELSEFDWRPVYLQVDQERQGALNR